MRSLKIFLEHVGFHLPVLHDWLAERDDLRTKYNGLWTKPGHFYSPIPSLTELENSRNAIFSDSKELAGIDLNLETQLDLLDRFQVWYDEQPFPAEKTPNRRYHFENPNFSYSDALVLYFMMRHLHPRRIIEVGSGFSSCAMLDVDELFLKGTEFTFIEPYPEKLLLNLLSETERSRLRIFSRNVQEIDPAVFQELEPNDILFIDSSHVSKTGSDVNYLMFKVLPALQPGVHIHVHDIFQSFEYPAEWVFQGRAWNESYLLRAFLSFNDKFKIQFFTSYLMHHFHNRFETRFPLMLKCPGAGIWISRVE